MAGLISAALRAITGAGGADVFSEIERLRSQIVVAKAEISQLKSLPIPRADSDAVVDARIAQMGEEATKALEGAVARMIRPDGAPSFLIDLTPAEHLAITVAVNPQALRATVGQILDRNYRGLKAVPTFTARATRISEIETKVLQDEVAEEGLVRKVEAAGIPILRRPDADPRAVLARIDT